ncbi:MAG: S8 family serine peptidase [Verrucomicrobiae bacterium]|nr:S8 family serine peptidase [Verrucomicrobiae bacterium]
MSSTGNDDKGNFVVKKIINLDHTYLLVETSYVRGTGGVQKVSQVKVANQVIVRLREGSKESDLRNIILGCEGKILKKIYGENAYVVELKSLNFETLPRAITYFNDHSAIVKRVSENYVKFLDAVPNDPNFKKQWGLHWQESVIGDWYWKNFSDADIDAPEAWEITKGSASVVVGVIDTGIAYNHPDLAPNMWKNTKEIANNGLDDDGNGLVDDVYGYDFWKDNGDPMDSDTHGTHVAGIIGSAGNNNVGVAGVNWTVKLMALKCGNVKSIYSDAFLSAVNYAIDQGVKILNCSFGGAFYGLDEKEALEKAKAAGILVVCSAGNDSSDNDETPVYPASASFDNIIAVTGTDRYDEFDEEFNYGKTNVDLAAPGDYIYSTVSSGGYDHLSGTSMAAPLVAGVAALIKSKKPEWSYAKIKQEILESVDKKNSLQGKCVTGGRLNAFRALKNVAQGPVEFISSNYVADETVMIHSVLVRRYGAANAASVSYQVINGSAKAGQDFTLSQGVLNFSAGQLEKAIVFFVNKDGMIEGEETFTIKLSNPQGMALGSKQECAVSIVDNSPGVIELVLPEFVAYESIGKVTVTAVRKGGSFGPASVQYSVSSLFEGPTFAKAGQDYLFLPGGSLTWKDGESGTKSFTITLIDDAITELLEKANISLFNVKGATLNNKKTADLLIEDNEPTQYFFYKYPGYAINSYEVTEGAKTYMVEIARKGFRKKENVHFVTKDGTAKGEENDLDYVAYSTDLSFQAKSEGVWQIALEVVADQIAEGDEFYSLKLIPQSAQSLGSTATTIIKNGSQPGTLKLQNEFSEITEGDVTEFYIVRENGTDGAVSIDYKIEGTAQVGADYEILNGLAKTGTIHFESGQSIAAVQFSIIEDGIVENDESIKIMLFNPKNGVQLGIPSQGEIVIQGDASN